MQEFSPWSKSTTLPSDQSRSLISSRVTTSPGRRTSISRMRKGCGGRWAGRPPFRTSPLAKSISKGPKRTRRTSAEWAAALVSIRRIVTPRAAAAKGRKRDSIPVAGRADRSPGAARRPPAPGAPGALREEPHLPPLARPRGLRARAGPRPRGGHPHRGGRSAHRRALPPRARLPPDGALRARQRGQPQPPAGPRDLPPGPPRGGRAPLRLPGLRPERGKPRRGGHVPRREGRLPLARRGAEGPRGPPRSVRGVAGVGGRPRPRGLATLPGARPRGAVHLGARHGEGGPALPPARVRAHAVRQPRQGPAPAGAAPRPPRRAGRGGAVRPGPTGIR